MREFMIIVSCTLSVKCYQCYSNNTHTLLETFIPYICSMSEFAEVSFIGQRPLLSSPLELTTSSANIAKIGGYAASPCLQPPFVFGCFHMIFHICATTMPYRKLGFAVCAERCIVIALTVEARQIRRGFCNNVYKYTL